eukprot:1158984-Pelagomonas_calceolata.AAC.3
MSSWTPDASPCRAARFAIRRTRTPWSMTSRTAPATCPWPMFSLGSTPASLLSATENLNKYLDGGAGNSAREIASAFYKCWAALNMMMRVGAFGIPFLCILAGCLLGAMSAASDMRPA